MLSNFHEILNKKRFLAYVSILAGFTFFIIVLPIRLKTILYYDEIFDLQPIQQLISGCAYVRETHHTPLLFGCIPFWASNGYQGTLRAAIFFPLMKMHLLDPVTFLMVNSVLFSIAIYVLLSLFSSYFKDFKWRYWAALLVILQPVVWSLFAFDLGPTSTQFLLRCLLLISVWGDVKKKIFASWVTIFLCAFLIWGKLDGLWFVAGIILGQLLVQGRLQYRRANIKGFFPLVFIFGVGILFALQSGNFLQSGNAINWQNRIFQQLPTDLSNGIVGLVIPSDNRVGLPFALPLLVLMLLSLSGLHITKELKDDHNFRFYNLIRVQTLVVILFLAITPSATAPWHTVSLWPTMVVLVGGWLSLVIRETSNKLPTKSFNSFLAALLVASLLSAIYSSVNVLNKMYNQDINPLFSRGLAETFSRIPQNTDVKHASVFTTWGIYNSAIMDNSFTNQIILPRAVDFYDPFSITDSKSRKEYFRWALESGPLAKFDSFTFVEFNLAQSLDSSKNLEYLGSKGFLKTMVNDFSLCEVEINEYKLANSAANLVTVNASRC